MVAYDFGIKRNILRLLNAHGCRVTVMPAAATTDEVMTLEPTAFSCPTAPATPRRSPMPSGLYASCWARSRCSASASATSCWGSPWAARPTS